jgi:hypothetical protein
MIGVGHPMHSTSSSSLPILSKSASIRASTSRDSVISPASSLLSKIVCTIRCGSIERMSRPSIDRHLGRLGRSRVLGGMPASGSASVATVTFPRSCY